MEKPLEKLLPLMAMREEAAAPEAQPPPGILPAGWDPTRSAHPGNGEEAAGALPAARLDLGLGKGKDPPWKLAKVEELPEVDVCWHQDLRVP